MHAHIHTYIHTYIHAYIHTYIHTDFVAHTCMIIQCSTAYHRLKTSRPVPEILVAYD